MDDNLIPTHLTTIPILGFQSNTVSLPKLSTAERRDMLKAVRAGDLIELDIQAVVFRAVYPNANFMRFYDQDLPVLASTFPNQPFLANHDTYSIARRLGTIKESRLQGDEILQTIGITTQTGLEAYLQGTIDRFSIGWFYQKVNCSICGTDWFACNHWPGQSYEVGHDKKPTLCELYFTNPTGKETSAVNVPAVRGTHVLADATAPSDLASDFAQLHAAKLSYQAMQTTKGTLILTTPATNTHPDTPATTPLTTQEETKMELDATAVGATNDAVTPPVAAQVTIPAGTIAPQLGAALNTAGWVLTNIGQLQAAPAPAPAPEPTPAPEPVPANTPAPIVATDSPDATLWTNALRETVINGMLAQSGLPPAAMRAVRSSIRAGDSPEVVLAMIETQREVISALDATPVVQNMRPATPQAGRINMLTEVDKIKEAAFALFDNKYPKNTRRLAGLRELYTLLSGDYEMTGRFMPDAVLTNITTSTMPDLMAEWMNQRVVSLWSNYDKWFEQLCRIENFTSLRDPHWIRVGGLGELSTVGEGSPYTEKEWAAETETTGWTKRGNWLGITLEAIDRDNTAYIVQLPQVLIQSAWLTINKDFTRRLITANGAGYGYTMASDSKALFHADHGNLGSTALSVASWQATKLAMTAQTEYNTGEKLGALTLPRMVMIPRALEPTAITVFGTEQLPGGANNDINPEVQGGGDAMSRIAAAKRMYIINDYLTDANDWFAFANPQMMPLFGLGYRWGETPEIYSLAQSDQTSGLMFTNDVLPIKIRWYYSLGAIDWRGMYHHKVA